MIKVKESQKEDIMKWVIERIVEDVEQSTMGTIKNNIGEIQKGRAEERWQEHNVRIERMRQVAMRTIVKIIER